MKKHFLSLSVIVLAAAFSAFTTAEGNSKKTQEAFWYRVDPSTNEVLDDYGFISRESAQSLSGCSGSAAICDKGYSNDLYNVGDEAIQTTNMLIKHQ